MTNRIHSKQRFSMGKITLLLGIASVLLPPFFTFGSYLCILLIGGPCLAVLVPYGFYAFFGLYFVMIIVGGILGIIDLCGKPRLWHKENTKTIIGIACIVFSLIIYGRIIIFSEYFQSVIQRLI